MRIHEESLWDTDTERYEFMEEVDKLDSSHKRAKKELRKQQRALAKKNTVIKLYCELNEKLLQENKRLEISTKSLQDSLLFQSEEIDRLNGYIDEEEKVIKVLEKGKDDKLTALESKVELISELVRLESKLSYLEQENIMLRKQQANNETEVQDLIIQSMNDTITRLREQLYETEEKYNSLLNKYVFYEK